MSSESEPNVATELETTCSMGKDVACMYPLWQCPCQQGQSLGVQTEAGLPIPDFPMGCHAMRVGDRRDGNNTGRKLRTTLDIAQGRWDDAGVSRRRRRGPNGGSTVG
jgi:hypothetical protein